MCAPATAALLLAALSALPCRGTDTDSGPRVSNETNNQGGAQPTINKVYQILHATELRNQTEAPNFNYPELKGLNFVHSLSNNLNSQKCCAENKSLDSDRYVNNSTFGRNKRVMSAVKDSGSVTGEPQTMALERRKKPGETGSSAPLLNYIFDTYSNTHQHRNEKVGTGNSIYAAAAPEVDALVGSTTHLDCKVDAIHDKLVSWVRRKNDQEPMELLTTGTQQYTADDRYSARFIPPDIWRLAIRDVRPTDAAHYDCQLSAHPPRTARVTLRVPEVSIRIVDGAGAAVSEQVCEVGSTVALRCEVRGLRMEGGPTLLWYRREALLNDDTTRGGISVRTEFGPNGANSVLRVARVRMDDAGRYTCTVARAPPPSTPPAFVLLHVIKGESLAELHQGFGTSLTSSASLVLAAVLLIYNFI